MSERMMPVLRYGLRRDSEGGWEVYDVFTDETAEVNCVPQNGLDIEEADEIVDLLNADIVARRKGQTH